MPLPRKRLGAFPSVVPAHQSRKAAARELGVHPNTVIAMLLRGELAGVEVDGVIQPTRASVLAAKAARAAAAGEPPPLALARAA